MQPATLTVVLPAFNEAGYLGPALDRLIAGLARRPRPFTVVVCENGSTDGTAGEAEEAASRLGHVQVRRLTAADYGAALRAGFEAADGDIVVNFDVDFVDLDFLDRALELLEADPSLALVLGSKRQEGSSDRRPPGRRLVTAVFSAIMRLGFGLRVSDTHGVKAMRRLALAPVVARCRFGRDLFDTEVVLRAERAGLGVGEIPVDVSDLRPPRTSIVRRIPRSLVGLIRLRLVLAGEGRHRPRAGSR